MSDPATKPRDVLPRPPLHRLTARARRFLEVESSSGLMLVVCTVAALVLANSAWAKPFHDFWEVHLRVGVGRFTLDEPLHFWVNDALMTLFFFVVGMEIKRELVGGELSSVRKAALPVVAAAGGMVVPAGVYLALQAGTPGGRGWGVPMATDIAFVVGVLAVLGRRVPFGLKIFLLSLAIVDDIGAILVIAVAYSGGTDLAALAAAAGGLGLCYLLGRLGVRTIGVYALVATGVWLATLKSGVHPTIAGVALGLITPTAAWVGPAVLTHTLSTALGRVQSRGGADRDDLEHLEFAAREASSPLERLEHGLHPWVGFVIMPLFALANAGVAVGAAGPRNPVAIAVILGLVVGKPVGIIGFSFLAVRLRLAELPTGVNWAAMAGAGCLGGIGFTMSLFVADLAFADPVLLDAAKVGILVGSAVSAVIGTVLLLVGLRPPRDPG